MNYPSNFMWLVKFQLHVGTQYFRAFILRLINLECCSCASYLWILSKGLCYKIRLQSWMNIISDKFPCRNRMFTHEWLGKTVEYVYTGAHHCQRFSISMWKKVFKIPLTKLTTHLFSHVEFEAEITTPRHFNPFYQPPLNSSSFYALYHLRLYFSPNFTLLMFVNIRQRTPLTSPIMLVL